MAAGLIIWILVGVYGVLMLLAAFSQQARKTTTLFDALAAFSLIFAALIGILQHNFLAAFWMTALGFILVSLAAFIQGRQTGLHWRHHVVRGILEIIVLILLYFFLKI